MNKIHNIVLARYIIFATLFAHSTIYSVAWAQERDGAQMKEIAPQSASTDSVNARLPAINAGDNFKTENLIPWCMVAFDAKQRTPEARAQMIVDLGMKRSAYAWRERHLPEFEREIEAYRAHNIKYFAFFNWQESIEPLIEKHKISPQIWHYMQFKPTGSQEEKVSQTAQSVKSLVDKTRAMGLKFGLYNHGGWTGEPENMVAVVEHIRNTQPDSDHVGIVYNFHHGHHDIENFAVKFKRMLPYLLCVNLNGMADANLVNEETLENKILTIGTGTHEYAMIKEVVDSGYTGPIGIIDHRNELDSEVAFVENIRGLKDLLSGKVSVGVAAEEQIAK